MSLFRRITTTVHASVERLVDLMENHEAVVNLALDESRQALARGKAQLGRIQRECERLRGQIRTLESEEARWVERARAVAATDETAALQCLQRRRDCRRQSEDIRQALAEHSGAEARLLEELRAGEERLQAATRQRDRLRTRQSAAEVNRALGGIAERFPPSLEDSFERWETRVLENELIVGQTAPVDELARRFGEQESQAELRAELASILRTERSA